MSKYLFLIMIILYFCLMHIYDVDKARLEELYFNMNKNYKNYEINLSVSSYCNQNEYFIYLEIEPIVKIIKTYDIK